MATPRNVCREGTPFSPEELPLGRYTLRLDGKKANDIQICEELDVDDNGVIWRNGSRVGCHQCSYQAYEEKDADWRSTLYCSTKCNHCYEGTDEIRRTCDSYGVVSETRGGRS